MSKSRNAQTITTVFTMGLADGEQGVITGVAHVCGLRNGTYPPSILESGAFTKTLSENGSRVVLNIDHGNGLMAEVGYGEFEMHGDSLVLKRGVLNMESTQVREEVYPRLKQRADAGIPSGLSIEVSWPKDKAKMRDGVLHISEVKLTKVGIVDVPANQPSLVSTVMAEVDDDLDTEMLADEPDELTEDMKRGDKAKKRAAMCGINSKVRECAKEIYRQMSTMRALMEELEASEDDPDTEHLSLAEPEQSTTLSEPDLATTPQGLDAGDLARLGTLELNAEPLRRYVNG